MARTVVALHHTESDVVKRAPVGFSWSTFVLGLIYLGFCPAFSRRDMKWGQIMLVAQISALILTFISSGFLWPIEFVVAILFGFIYNDKHIDGLLRQGFVPADEHSLNALKEAGKILTRQKHRTPANVEIEKAVLRNARDRGGVVTVVSVAMTGDYSMDDVKQSLDHMVNEGHAENGTRKGELVYVFRELLSSENREDLDFPK